MNLLITSVGRRSYMVEYFKDALKQNGKVYVTNSEETVATSVADGFDQSPPIYDESYIDFLLELCRLKDISAIISLFDIDLPILAENKKRFADQGVSLILSDFEVCKVCNDKWLTYKFFENNKLRTPITFIELSECQKSLLSGHVSFPIILKPRWGMGSLGIFQADNMDELIIFYSKALEVIKKTYLKYEADIDITRAIVMQEKLIGQEFGLDVFNDLDAKYICTIPKKKISMRAGETDVAEIIKDETLENYGALISSKLKHIANLDIDCFLVGDDYFFLELNCRFGGQYPFSHLAGANFPQIIIDSLLGKGINEDNLKVTFGTRGYKDLVIRSS